jgi:hypothetical protein
VENLNSGRSYFITPVARQQASSDKKYEKKTIKRITKKERKKVANKHF